MAKKDLKVVIVGASSGIGEALAEALASRGVKVGVAARSTAKLEGMKKKYPETVHYATIDVTKTDAADKLKELADRMGGMDIYIHASGVGFFNPELKEDEEMQTVRTNVGGFARMISAAYRYMRDGGQGGQIVGITSVAGTKGMGMMAAYSAAKSFDSTYMAALDQLSHMQNTGITFTDIRPGWVRTPLLDDEGKYPMEMKLESVVPQILRAIVKKRRVAVIDWRWNILVGLWRLLPNAIWTRIPYGV